MVELVLGEVASANPRLDPAGGHVDDDGGALQRRLRGRRGGAVGGRGCGRLRRLKRGQLLVHRALQRTLQAQVDVGAYGQALRHFLGAFHFEDLLQFLHRGDHHVGLAAVGLGRQDAYRRLDRAHVVLARDVAEVEHGLERLVAAPLRLLRVGARRGSDRRADDAGQQRAFGNRELRGVLAKVAARRRADAEVPLPEINPVEVVVHDLVLRQVLLEADGDEGLEEFAVQGAGEIADEVLGELLLDRAAALHAVRLARQVLAQRADDAPVIDGAVLIEPLVFRRHDRLAHGVRDLVRLEDDAVLHEDAAKFLAVDVIKRGGDIQVIKLLEVVGLRARVIDQRLLVDDVADPARHHDADDEEDLERDNDLAPERPLPLRLGPAGRGTLRLLHAPRLLQRGARRLLRTRCLGRRRCLRGPLVDNMGTRRQGFDAFGHGRLYHRALVKALKKHYFKVRRNPSPICYMDA